MNSKKLRFYRKLIITSIFSVVIFLSSRHAALAWTDTGGGDHAGADWTITTNTTVAGVHTNVGAFTVNTGVTATIQAYDGTSYGTFQVQATSANIVGTIQGSGKGYTSTYPGTGNGTNASPCTVNDEKGGGGGHGGAGGPSDANTTGGVRNDLTLSPSLMGGAGGKGNLNGTCLSGGIGGGAVKITTSGTFTLSGSILVSGNSGTDWNSGGGAGGSIWLVANSYAGTGTLTAGGGSGVHGSGGGAGGRIAVHYSSGSIPSWTATANYTTGGVENGTVVYKDDVNNDVTIKNSQTWDANPSIDTSSVTLRDLTLSSSAVLSIAGYYTTSSNGVGITLNVRNLTINTGSSINGVGYGYSNTGTGKGGDANPCSDNIGAGGGGYGGAGGTGGTGAGGTPGVGGSTYGSSTAPVDLGSSGGRGSVGGCANGGNGGSAIKILASGTLTLSGTISMNGSASSNWERGGGSGGSIFIVANILAGTSNVTANGGAASHYGGGGGGGRIAVYYQTSTTWSGSMTATASQGGATGSTTTGGWPRIPSTLAQYKSDGTTVINAADQTNESTVVLKVSMAAGTNMTLTPEFEVRDIGTSFSNVATNTGSGVAYTGTPVTGSATVTGLPDATNYHWQSRVCNGSNCSAWVANGGSPYDFRVFTNQTPNAPSSLGPTAMTDGSSTNDTTPTFTFTQSDPDAGNTVYFTFVLSTASDYSTWVLQYDSGLIAQGSASFTVGQLAGSGLYSHGGIANQTLTNGSYYWRVKTTDNSGAVSGWIEGRSGSPAFVIDASGPNVNATNISLTNALDGEWTGIEPSLSWTAGSDAGAGNLLGYCVSLSETAVGGAVPGDDPTSTAGVLQGLDDGVSQAFCPYIVTGTSLDLSAVSGLTLTTNKHYYFSIAAVDTAGNFFTGSAVEIKNLVSFKYDGVVPVNVTSISAPGGSFSNINDMYFSWPTSGGIAASDTGGSGLLGYQYSLNDQSNWHGTQTDTNTGLSIIPVATTPPLNLDVTRDGSYLTVGTNIIYFRTIDIAGNISSAATYRTASISYGGDAPTFPGNATVIVDPSVATENSFSLSWNAASPATNRTIKKYYWMVNTLPPAVSSPPNLSYQTMVDNPGTYFETTATSVAAQALPAVVRGANTVYVIAVDDLDNYSPSNYISGSFTLNTESPDAPKNLAVSDASIKEASLWRASLAWSTPDYIGLGDLLYTVQRSTDGATWTTVGTTAGTAYVDTVSTSSRYYWRVGTNDSGGNNNATPTWSNAVTLIPKGSFTSAAELTSGPVATGLTTKKAKITWTTGRGSDSKVAYGTETGKYNDEEPSNSTQVTDHTINLTNLSPGTKYYYVAKWTDEDGNTGVSPEKDFTTESAPVIKDVTVSNLGLDNAVISFTTIHASKIKLYFGKSTDFGGVKEIATSTAETTYSAQLSDLEDGTKYYYKINSFDTENAEYEGTILDFTTFPRPKISEVKLQQVAGTAESTILVTWQSNTPVSSVISVNPSSDTTAVRNVIDLALKEGPHSLVVDALLPATDYTLIVKGSDKLGNQAVSAPVTFTTASDTRPPAIINLKVIGGTVPPVGFAAGTINAQLVVTWDTDEPATSQVEYGEGTGTDYSSKSSEDGNLTANHVVVISGLTPSQVYHLRAVSLDAAKNDGRSIDTVTIAPKATRSALDLVMANLTQVFGAIKLFSR